MESNTKYEPRHESKKPNDSVLRGFFGYVLKRTYLIARPTALAGMAQFDLRVPSFSCLSLIVENPGIAPSSLAECLRMERPNIVVIIDELESRDLITRQRSSSDKRRFELRATVRGRHLHDKAALEIHRQEERLLAGLSEEERAQLIQLLGKIERLSSD